MDGLLAKRRGDDGWSWSLRQLKHIMRNSRNLGSKATLLAFGNCGISQCNYAIEFLRFSPIFLKEWKFSLFVLVAHCHVESIRVRLTHSAVVRHANESRVYMPGWVYLTSF